MNKDEKRMSIAGEAPRLVLFLLPILAAAVLLTVLWPSAMDFLGKFWGVGVAAGIVLALAGLPFWLSAAVSLLRAYKKDRIAMKGAYGLSRHPIFAWWIFSVLPASALILNSLAFLLAAVLFALIALPSMKREDAYLEARYGQEFRYYRSKVRMLVPLPYLRPFRWGRYVKAAFGFAGIGVLVLAGYFVLIRPVVLGLGTSAEERNAALPGDELISNVHSGYTQAVTIDAAPEEVWPWLVQVGYKRAGWYNVDAINRLADPNYFYEGKRSLTRIVGELQELKPGDLIHMVPQLGMVVTTIEENRLLVLAGDPSNPDAENNAIWTYQLSPLPKGKTRIVVRFQSNFPGGFIDALLNGFVNEIGGAIIQQPAMLQGLRSRAEAAS